MNTGKHFLTIVYKLSASCCSFAHTKVKGTLIFKIISVLVTIKPTLRKIAHSTFAILIAVFASISTANAQPDGKALFMSNCASCHNPLKDATGPALKGVDERVPSKEWLYDWIHNSAAVIASGDAYANKIYGDWGKTAMTAFPSLSEEEIDAVIAYVNSVEPPAAVPTQGGAVAEPEQNTWLYTLITVVLLVFTVILWRINHALRRVALEKQGLPNHKEVPVYRNKVFIAIAVVVLIIGAGYWITNGAVEMGRQQNYMPEQPIFYSHKVHAGVNQINCQYCHAGVTKSKQAMIPSTNVCMNCHMQINEYTGEQLYTHEGEEINGTAEIHKLYEYSGWNPDKKAYNRDADGNILAKPIEWVKIHNLPDHVYFNHSQHVAVGKVDCQRCHGEIQDMDEVFQFSPLSMGWCINCHRETEVQFANNDYYSIFEKYHEEIKAGTRTSVTVDDIGGTECQKCHY
ncbi:MAG: c-type cytochrome [Chitinophagales bacterium]|nr:c-type cytochrome [Chitinophagaceae bacterium]MCB9065304.1 c-type cytochrome [Chitinophagales bacterium]